MTPYRTLAQAFVARWVSQMQEMDLEPRRDMRCLDVGAKGQRGAISRSWQRWQSVDIQRGPCVTVQADMGSLPFHEDLFDLVKATDVLYHAARPWVVLEELARVLHRGGRLIVTVPYVVGRVEPGDKAHWSQEAWQSMLSGAGLIDALVEPLSGPPVTLLHLVATWTDSRLVEHLLPLVRRFDAPSAWAPCGFGIVATKP
jgi:SAM-dependent methyltransferase